MFAKVIFAFAFCLTAVHIIGAVAVVEESDDLIVKIEDEFLEVDNEWEDHSGEVLEELMQGTEVEGCHPDGHKIKKCLKEYLPAILTLRKKIVEQKRAVKGDLCRLRSCRRETCPDKRKQCVLKIGKEIRYDISLLKIDLKKSKGLLHELCKCIHA